MFDSVEKADIRRLADMYLVVENVKEYNKYALESFKVIKSSIFFVVRGTMLIFRNGERFKDIYS